MLSLQAYVARFVRGYMWPCDVPCYNDVIRCVIARMHVVTQAAIYEAVVGKPYGDPVRMYLESACMPCKWTGVLYSRITHIKIEYAPVTIHASQFSNVIEKFRNCSYYIEKWITKCIAANKLDIVTFVIENMRPSDIVSAGDLMQCAILADNPDAVMMIHSAFGHKTRIKQYQCYVRPATYALLSSLGYKFKRDDYEGILRCESVGVHVVPYAHDYDSLLQAALELGIGLDWLCKVMTLPHILEPEHGGYHNRTIAWFLDKGVRVTQLDHDAIDSDNVEYLIPRVDAYDRAWLLAKVDNAVGEYKKKRFTYHVPTFMQYASLQAVTRVAKINKKPT